MTRPSLSRTSRTRSAPSRSPCTSTSRTATEASTDRCTHLTSRTTDSLRYSMKNYTHSLWAPAPTYLMLSSWIALWWFMSIVVTVRIFRVSFKCVWIQRQNGNLSCSFPNSSLHVHVVVCSACEVKRCHIVNVCALATENGVGRGWILQLYLQLPFSFMGECYYEVGTCWWPT